MFRIHLCNKSSYIQLPICASQKVRLWSIIHSFRVNCFKNCKCWYMIPKYNQLWGLRWFLIMALIYLFYYKGSCNIASAVKSVIAECHADYSRHHLDERHYNGSWNVLSHNQTTLTEEDYNPWHFNHQGTLSSKPLYGTNQILVGERFNVFSF